MVNKGQVFAAVGSRIRAAVAGVFGGIVSVIRSATRPLPIGSGLVRDVARSKAELVAENMLLRQQLIVAERQFKRPTFRPHERGVLVLLARLVRW